MGRSLPAEPRWTPDTVPAERTLFYAAATRARSLLVVVGDPEAAEAVGLDELADRLRGGSPAAGGGAEGSDTSQPVVG